MIAAYPLSVSTGDDYAARLGLVLRTARYVREMTREAVAEGCEVSAETVARWERGNVDLRGHALSVLAEVLRLPADLLLDPPATRSAILVKIAAFDQARDYPAGPRP
jgi:transcriptional regulator with XRE-family HTH domain